MVKDVLTIELEPVLPGLFVEGEEAEGGTRRARLIGGFCPSCGRYYFPVPARCRSCLGPVEERTMGATGRVYSLTVVRIRAPLGLPQPYSVGLVDLDDVGLRVFALLDPQSVGLMNVGDAVELRAAPLGVDLAGRECRRPFFARVDQGGRP
jgi:uncharacterized OB-fold protein